jgi:hypothetical protein
MAHIKPDRVRELSQSTGTGNFVLSGAVTSFRTFASVASVNDTFFYTIAALGLNEWEVGLGTYTAANTFQRTTIISSSNANSTVNFSAGDKDVFITSPGSKFLQADSSDSYGSFTAATITAALTGNASTATTWQTARTLTIGSTGKSVNGSANVSWSLAEIGAQAAGSYLTAEADTLATVTGRGASTSTLSTFSGGIVASAGIYGAASGAPDVAIWMVSPSNPTWGIFYNEGTPDYIEFKANGTVTSKIALDSGDITTTGGLYATTKSFLIDHPTKEGMKLRYGSLEGPENGVYVRGKLKGRVIELPEYWTKLVDPDSITVQLTAIGKGQKLYVEDIRDNKIYINNDGLFAGEPYCFYYILAERIDVEKLQVEIG